MISYSDAGAGDIATVHELFAEYGHSLGIDLSFQGFDAELATLPGAYAPPDGAVIIARQDGAACGCVGRHCCDFSGRRGPGRVTEVTAGLQAISPRRH